LNREFLTFHSNLAITDNGQETPRTLAFEAGQRVQKEREILVVIAKNADKKQLEGIRGLPHRRGDREPVGVHNIRHDRDVPRDSVRTHFTSQETADRNYLVCPFQRKSHFESIAGTFHERAKGPAVFRDHHRSSRPCGRENRSKARRQCNVRVHDVALARSDFVDYGPRIVEMMDQIPRQNPDANQFVPISLFNRPVIRGTWRERRRREHCHPVSPCQSASLFGNEDSG
jgi:hypothetical protein